MNASNEFDMKTKIKLPKRKTSKISTQETYRQSQKRGKKRNVTAMAKSYAKKWSSSPMNRNQEKLQMNRMHECNGWKKKSPNNSNARNRIFTKLLAYLCILLIFCLMFLRHRMHQSAVCSINTHATIITLYSNFSLFCDKRRRLISQQIH